MRGSPLRGLSALIPVAVAIAGLAGSAAADEAYSQPPNAAGGQYKSAWYAEDGLDSDEYVWDDFTLASSTAITEVRWRGAYTNYLSGVGKAPVYDFTVAIYGSIGGFQPDVVNGPLVEYQVGGNAGETSAGSAGGVLMYDYAFVLPSPFQAAAGVKYWVQIEAWQGLTPPYYWPPDWSIARGTGGNNAHFRKIGGTGGTFYSITGDCAFTLMRSGAPTFTINTSVLPSGAGTVMGAGAYPSGSNATLEATANAGFGFVNWTENGSQVSTNWRYTFNVTRNRTLIANFVSAYTVTTGSAPIYGGEVTGAGVYNSGSLVTATAVARQGYFFDHWTDWGNPVSTEPVYTFTITGDRSLQAHFVPAPMTVTFDLDSGDPPPIATMTMTPFDNAKAGVVAHFAGADGLSAYSLQSDATISWSHQVRLTGNYLWPNSIYRNNLEVTFDRRVTSVSLDFATEEMEAWADTPSPLVLTAYLNDTPVGGAQAAGAYGATTYPEGFLLFTSAAPFNRIVLTVGPNPWGTNNFISDNFTIEALCPADFDANGFVNGEDFDAFVWEFELGNAAADFDANGFVNGEDFDLFAAAFEAGC